MVKKKLLENQKQKKTKKQAIFLRTKHTVLELTETLYIVNDAVNIVNEIKALGVTFPEALSWNKQVENICNKLNCVTGLTNKKSNITNKS